MASHGGDAQLHRDISDATRQITDACNLKLDFGCNEEKNVFRTWSPQDTSYTAEVRVSFDQAGYWSLVGNDGVYQSIGRPQDAAGGRVNQRSLNLARFDVARPSDWKGNHAARIYACNCVPSLTPESQRACQQEFRWEDDAGYEHTTNAAGSYRPDSKGWRPGIYIYLSGPPNRWSRPKVDHNLRAHAKEGNYAGSFDSRSVMLYHFPALFYKTVNGLCAPTGDGQNLSPGDIEGLQYLYPNTPAAAQADIDRPLTRIIDAIWF